MLAKFHKCLQARSNTVSRLNRWIIADSKLSWITVKFGKRKKMCIIEQFFFRIFLKLLFNDFKIYIWILDFRSNYIVFFFNLFITVYWIVILGCEYILYILMLAMCLKVLVDGVLSK